MGRISGIRRNPCCLASALDWSRLRTLKSLRTSRAGPLDASSSMLFFTATPAFLDASLENKLLMDAKRLGPLPASRKPASGAAAIVGSANVLLRVQRAVVGLTRHDICASAGSVCGFRGGRLALGGVLTLASSPHRALLDTGVGVGRGRGRGRGRGDGVAIGSHALQPLGPSGCRQRVEHFGRHSPR
eukprot:scaffold1313_cov250-Pinguiococcus_pyrenoidosus.AAC.19